MGKPDAPETPDPRETSAAQTGTSISTAIANSFLGNVDRVGPDGTTKYSQTGAFDWKDPYTGQTYQVPRFTETVTMSPEAQGIFDKQQAAKGNLADLASQQSGFLKDYLGKPIDLNNEEVESRLFDLGSKRLDPRFAQEREALDSKLSSQGIKLGTEAYDRAVNQFSQGKNDAYNSLLLSGRGQAVQEALTQRNQPINEITALLSGSQVSQPQFTGTPQPQIPTTDNAGIINQDYQNRLNAWQTESQSMGGLFGGLLGLGGKIIGLSDPDAKKDMDRIGDLDGEMGLWAFRYKGEDADEPKHIGLMADEVEKEVPEAVSRRPDGYRQVDYGKALGSVFGVGA